MKEAKTFFLPLEEKMKEGGEIDIFSISEKKKYI